jgi:hypothetical protein
MVFYPLVCCAVLCCAVLCCAVLCCAVLCCAVLCVCVQPGKRRELSDPGSCAAFNTKCVAPASELSRWPAAALPLPVAVKTESCVPRCACEVKLERTCSRRLWLLKSPSTRRRRWSGVGTCCKVLRVNLNYCRFGVTDLS